VGQPILAAAGFQPASRYTTYVRLTIARFDPSRERERASCRIAKNLAVGDLALRILSQVASSDILCLLNLGMKRKWPT
jgi:hypothetical protein